MAFISLLDDRARPKGSRDPLGFELIWTHFGREVIGNLTTITSSLENFAVALLGFSWANELSEHKKSEELQAEAQRHFLRYEQVAAYLRYYQGSGSIMGKNRVARRVNDSEVPSIEIHEKTQQILSNQVSYGLWGLYSSAMRDTRLISGNERKPTPDGLEIVSLIEDRLDKKALIKLLSSSRVEKEHLEKVSQGFVSAINDEAVQQKLLQSLLLGSGGNELQQELWKNTEAMASKGTLPESDDLPVYLSALLEHQPSEKLERALKWINDIERILTATNNLFNYCRVKDGEAVAAIIRSLEAKEYGYSWLIDNLNGVEFPRKAALEKILNALKQSNYQEAITVILQLNKEVMRDRGGAPWVEIMGDKLRVAVKSETARLAENSDELQQRWDYEYFLKSYLRIARHYKPASAASRS